MDKVFVRILSTVAAFVSLSAVAGPCQDREAALRPNGYDITLARIVVCLGEASNDDDQLVVTFNQATPDTKDEQQRAMSILKATQLLQEAVAQRTAQQNANTALWQRIDTRLTEERKLLNKLSSGNADHVRVALYPSEFWTNLPAGAFGSVDGVPVNALAPTCDNSQPTCPVYEDRKILIRIVKLGWRLAAYAEASNLAAHTKNASLLNDQWKAYFHEALPQYWWEVWVNGLRMGEKLCPKDPVTRVQQGFCKVPTNQLILLHPEAGLEWRSSATKQDDLGPVFVIEAIGFNQWQWGGEDGSTVSGQIGGSVIAAYGDRNGTPDWSYGAMVHFRGYNLGVTTNKHGDVGVLFNVALAGKYFGKRDKYLDYLQAIKKPSFKEVLFNQ